LRPTSLSSDALKARLGQSLGLSEWLVIEQSRVNAFADATDDHQFIHVDPERAAKETEFGGPIAHGFLTLAMLSRLAEGNVPVLEGLKISINYGFERIRFIDPVRVGDAIRAAFVLADVEEKGPGRFLLRFKVTVDIKGRDKPALVAEWLTMQITGEH
jgi:acyl dehydratase